MQHEIRSGRAWLASEGSTGTVPLVHRTLRVRTPLGSPVGGRHGVRFLRALRGGILAAAAMACACSFAAAAAEGPLLQYRFAAGQDQGVPNAAGPGFAGRIEGGAKATALPDTGGATALSLDGTSGCLQVEGSEGLHIGAEGFTVAATVRFADSGTVEAAPDTHDMILMKPQEYLFGRTGRSLYLNIHDGRDWAGSVTGGECRPNVWTHAAAIVERIDEPPQGRVGYFVRLYLNGEMVAAREILNCTGASTANGVNVGKGWGGPWFFHGEMAHLSVYSRALSDGEFNELLKQEKLAKVISQRIAAPDARFPALLAEARAAVEAQKQPRRRALARVLATATGAVHHVDTQAALLPFLRTVCRLAPAGRDPVREFAAAHPEFALFDNGRVGVALFAPRRGGAALCSVFDLAAGREILGEQRALWSLRYEPPGGGPLREVDSAAGALAAKVTLNRSRTGAILEWTHAGTEEHPFRFTARSALLLQGPRLSLNLAVENRSPAVALREVRFPMVRVRRLEEGTDHLLVPRMSGVLHANPVKSRHQYEGAYPSGAAHMQFFAYYDDRRGIYVACEDGKARSKALRAWAAGNDCEFSALWHVGCRGTGGNGFTSSGDAVLEMFRGDWFDAAQIYKRFARTAAWWPASRSRQDTPAWYRNLAVWFIGSANSKAAADDLIAMRKELGLPIGLHWYGWNTEPFDDDYPHFTPRPGFVETVARLQANDVHVKPYINARIWETRDRGDEDFQYTSVALPATVKDPGGKPATEGYNKRTFSPMCPTTALWQRKMADLCAQVAGHGVDGIYLDQIAAGRPRFCFDTTHPHAAGAGEAWLEQGYWPMLATIRRELKPRHPQLILNSEDASEPYMHLLDGYLPWRFVDIGHVPAYQAIYAGRIQLTSRHYDDTTYDALFPKAAEQMLYGEQIGWFPTGHLRANPAFKVFVKKLAHTRRAFLPFFNEGDMLKPPPFAPGAPTVTADWGFYGPRLITTPAVLHSVWRLGNSIAVLFVNTSCEPVTAQVAPDAAAWGLGAAGLRMVEFGEGKEPVVGEWRPGAPLRLSVPGYAMAAWLFAAGDAKDAGHPVPGAREGGSTVRDTAGQGKRAGRPAQVAGAKDAGHAARVAAAAALFRALKGFDDEAEMAPERKRSERDRRDPWSVPDTPARPASEWIPAAAAPKMVLARVSPDGTYVGWIGSASALCFGPVDLGADTGGKPVIECEVAVPPEAPNARVRFMEAVPGRGGVPLVEGKLAVTGGYGNFATVRIPCPAGTAGVKNIVVQFSGRGAGICNFRRWRLVREP